MEALGLFGELSVVFDHHIRDIDRVPADIYPCRAAGYTRTLDADPLEGGERVAGCLTATQFCMECYGTDFVLENICPLELVKEEPFIARCCRAEREGTKTWNDKSGAIVHWGASPATIARCCPGSDQPVEDAMTRIAVVEGDGIGHEVIPVAQKALEVLHPEYEYFPVEVGYGRWEQTGCPCADRDISRHSETADAVLFGAVTTPPMKDYQSVVLRIRKALDLYANLRPVKGDGFDMMIARENTEGLYSGIEEIGPDRATTLRVVTRAGTKRIVREESGLRSKGEKISQSGTRQMYLKSDVFFRDICVAEAKMAGVSCTAKTHRCPLS